MLSKGNERTRKSFFMFHRFGAEASFSISAALAPHFVVEPIIKINYALKDVREDQSLFWFH